MNRTRPQRDSQNSKDSKKESNKSKHTSKLKDRTKQSFNQQLHRRHTRQAPQRSKKSKSSQSRNSHHSRNLIKQASNNNNKIKPIPSITQVSIIAHEEAHGHNPNDRLSRKNACKIWLSLGNKRINWRGIVFILVVLNAHQNRVDHDHQNDKPLQVFRRG